MKNLWKMWMKTDSIFIRMRRLAAAVAVGLATVVPSVAADKNAVPLEEMNFAELVNSVDPGKQVDLVRQFQEREASNVLLKNRAISDNKNITIDAIRNREVLVVTIPAHDLFGPNSTELVHGANKYLDPFKRYLKEPDMFRVLIVMHTDNTGSEAYREDITMKRAEAVFEWFENAGCNTDFLFPFAMSDDIPLVPNDSFNNRDRNRRLEIFLIPGEQMVEMAKKGRIAL